MSVLLPTTTILSIVCLCAGRFKGIRHKFCESAVVTVTPLFVPRSLVICGDTDMHTTALRVIPYIYST